MNYTLAVSIVLEDFLNVPNDERKSKMKEIVEGNQDPQAGL